MFSATITEESLVDLRDLFRGYEAFQSGKRQKLSHIDNLLALALGYQRGYGNLVAAVRAGGYIFSVNAVDPMALAKYETANISCACGIDAYLLIYAHIGASASSAMDLCRTYLLFKMVYSTWIDLTSPQSWQRQGNILHSMLEHAGNGIQRNDKDRFQYLPGFGLWPLWELENLSLAKLGLSEHQPLADTLFQRVQNEEKMSYLYQFDPLDVYKPHLKKYSVRLRFLSLQKIYCQNLPMFSGGHMSLISGDTACGSFMVTKISCWKRQRPLSYQNNKFTFAKTTWC